MTEQNDMILNTMPLYKDDETIRVTILTNICRMMVRRGNLSSEIYRPNNKFDDTKFLHFFKHLDDNDTYKIPLDYPINGDKTNGDFDGSVVVVKFIQQSVSDINNNPVFNDFVKTYNKYHKIVVFFDAADKIYMAIEKKTNTEAFQKNNLMIDLMSFIAAPYDCELVDPANIKYMISPKMAKIYRNDPLAKYYNAKKGDILKIIRCSINNGNEVAYRKVVNSKPVFK